MSSKSSHNIRLTNFNFIIKPSRILDDILEYNATHRKDNWDSLAQYSFFVAIVHDHVTKFHAKNIDLKISYWECLMQENFSHVKVLDFALSCNDLILELIGRHCPALEYLNATSKYKRFHDESREEHLRLPVTDKGLAHLHQCTRLKTLVINEPRGALTRFGSRVWSNEITYDGLRFLLKSVKTLEELSYSDVGSVISHRFEDVDTLNLKVVRQFNPTEVTLREILRLCRNLEHLSLMCYESDLTPQALDLLCSSTVKLREIKFQNVCLNGFFDRFFVRFGESLTEISLSYHESEITFMHFVSIGRHCPNLRVFVCNQLVSGPKSNTRPAREPNHRPFSQLERLMLCGENIDVVSFLSHCTEFADNFEVLKIHEERSIMNVDEFFIKCVKAANIRHVELSRRLPCSKLGIRQIIEKYPKLEYFKVYCSENCDDLIKEYGSVNYQFKLIVKSRQNDSLWMQ